MPSLMHASVWLASLSMALDWRARTESGSMYNRITTTMDRVNTTPAQARAAMLRFGPTRCQMSTSPESTAIVNMSISSVKKRGKAALAARAA